MTSATDDVPEVSIAVRGAMRGRGVGTSLLRATIGRACALGLRALSLSVSDGNSARRISEREGLLAVGRDEESTTMLLTLKHGAIT